MSTSELLTVRDYLRYAVSRFHAAVEAVSAALDEIHQSRGRFRSAAGGSRP